MSNYEILASEAEGKTRYFAWKKDGEVPLVYTKSEVDNIVDDVTSTIPRKLSQVENDMGYITISDVPKVDTSYLATKGELKDVSDAIPTKTSQLTNDSGFIRLSDIPDVEIPKNLSEYNNDVGYITLSEVPEVDTSNLATKQELGQKQDKITDLDTIRSNADKGATAVQPITLNSYATITYVNNKVGNIETVLNNINSGG